MTFNVHESDADTFTPMQVDRLLQYISKIVLENIKNNLDLKQHFIYPTSHLSHFVNDLKKEPLLCGRDHPNNILEELGKRYFLSSHD